MNKNITQKTTFESGSSLRISTNDIDEAIQQLENAFTEGRLDDRELEDRISLALNAKTEHDLAISLLDLNVPEQAITITHARSELHRLKDSKAIYSDIKIAGQFILPKEYSISEIFGSCLLDLTSAQLESPFTTIHLSSVYGGVQIFIPPGVKVEIHGASIMGEIIDNVEKKGLHDDQPIIQIHAEAVYGDINVETKR